MKGDLYQRLIAELKAVLPNATFAFTSDVPWCSRGMFARQLAMTVSLEGKGAGGDLLRFGAILPEHLFTLPAWYLADIGMGEIEKSESGATLLIFALVAED